MFDSGRYYAFKNFDEKENVQYTSFVYEIWITSMNNEERKMCSSEKVP